MKTITKIRIVETLNLLSYLPLTIIIVGFATWMTQYIGNKFYFDGFLTFSILTMVFAYITAITARLSENLREIHKRENETTKPV